jgi:hypothetical protein
VRKVNQVSSHSGTDTLRSSASPATDWTGSHSAGSWLLEQPAAMSPPSITAAIFIVFSMRTLHVGYFRRTDDPLGQYANSGT